MIVKCLTQEGYLDSPNAVKKGHKRLTAYQEINVGNTYPVYGIIHYEGGFRYLLYDEFQMTYWYPAELFEIVDHYTPSNWYFKFNGQDSEPITAVWGYKELMDDDHIEELAELEPEANRIFLSAKEEMY
jgi:hypothetical protein